MEQTLIALLIDADNCPASKIGVILGELAKHGEVNIRRAYGNWKSPTLAGWAEVLHEHAIEPRQQFAYTKGKNATDSAMIIDAMDLLYTQNLSAFCIASSDSDFTPLAMRIRTNGLKVFGMGEMKTPQPFISACSKFHFLESLGAGPVAESEHPEEAKPIRKTANELKGDTKLVNLVRNAIEATSDEEGWAVLSAVGSHITKNAPEFDARNYGYRKLSDLIVAIELFEVHKDQNRLYLRNRKSKRSSANGQA